MVQLSIALVGLKISIILRTQSFSNKLVSYTDDTLQKFAWNIFLITIIKDIFHMNNLEFPLDLTYRCPQWCQINIELGNVLVPSGSKPLTESLLTEMWINQFHHMTPWFGKS